MVYLTYDSSRTMVLRSSNQKKILFQYCLDPFDLTANDRIVSLEAFEEQVDLHSIINFFMTPTVVARNIGISTSIVS